MLLPEQLKDAVSKVEDINWEFRTFLKIEDPEDLDEVIHQLHDELFKGYDCISCSNCCKVTTTYLTHEDIGRLSQSLDVKPKELIKKYLGRVNGEYAIETTPCPFLGESGCTVYDCRPEACRDYPHTDKDEMFTRLISLIENCSICPVVFELVERLKEHYADAFRGCLMSADSRPDGDWDMEDNNIVLQTALEEWTEKCEGLDFDDMYDHIIDTLKQDLSHGFLKRIDIISYLHECMENLADRRQYDKLLALYQLYFERYPDSFPEEHGFLHHYVIPYALYTGDRMLLESCLSHIADAADSDGFDLPYPELEIMLYNGYQDEYKALIQRIYPYLDMDYGVGRHTELNHVYLMIRLQEAYASLKDGTAVDMDDITADLHYYGTENVREIHDILGYLQEEHEDIRERLFVEWKAGSLGVLDPLVWLFARWMLDEKGMSFAVSYSIWMGIKPFMSCDREKSMTGLPADYTLDCSALVEYVRGNVMIFSSLNPYIVCFVWGISYVYEFLGTMDMGDDTVTHTAAAISKACKYHIITKLKEVLWQYRFVYTWPAPESDLWEFDGERRLFDDSFTSIPVVESYISRDEVPMLPIQHKRSQYSPYQPLLPVERTEAKVGRNDPCPCGSGKKYKKCCG